jgi:hypothetical protein
MAGSGPNSVWGCINSVVMRELPDELLFVALRFIVQQFQ